MNDVFSEEAYAGMVSDLFGRFPSYQTAGASAYKPGIDNMLFFDQLAGHPHRKYRTIHVAGTNGKGSVSNMLASVSAAAGLKTGLFTSPHILDFRERMRIISPDGTLTYISEKEVWDFVQAWNSTFDHLDLSFFEITTMMAFDWFARQNVDMAVIETGLGGRLDSTNIIVPELSVITNIGLDHCDMLGDTLPEIAFEKAGIIKPSVPVVVGESNPETDPVFERKVLYTNLPEPEYMGDRKRIMSLLTYADKTVPACWGCHDSLLSDMDLRGVYQERNLRTVLAASGVMGWDRTVPEADLYDALAHTAGRMDFHGRWEKVSDRPYVICDIGHNAHGLRYNFAQLEKMRAAGDFSSLIMVFGCVADKDTEAVLRILPETDVLIFTNAGSRRALPADRLMEAYSRISGEDWHAAGKVLVSSSVDEAIGMALDIADKMSVGEAASSDAGCRRPLVYVGGSTYVVSEAERTFGIHYRL